MLVTNGCFNYSVDHMCMYFIQLTICACTLYLYLKSFIFCKQVFMLVISKEAIVCNNRSVRIKCNQKILQMVVIICLSMA